jgi:hypothetical protein
LDRSAGSAAPPKSTSDSPLHRSFASLGLVCFSILPHGLRRGLHSFAASRLRFLNFATSPWLYSCAASRLDGRDARPPFEMRLVMNHFYSTLRSDGLKNRMESAVVARSGPVYLMIQAVLKHLPVRQRLKPRLILRDLRHD